MAQFCKEHLETVMGLSFEEGKRLGWWCGEDGICDECGFDYQRKKNDKTSF